MKSNKQLVFAWFVFAVLVVGFCCVIYFRWYEFFNYEFLKAHHDLFSDWVRKYYFYTFLIYMIIYITVAAFSLPVGLMMTLLGGFLFGPIATVYVVISATIGATILFWAVQTSIGRWFLQYDSFMINRLQQNIRKNGFNYLLAARLVPVFPFWAVNIAAGLIGIPPRTFIFATFLGVIPGSFIYVMLGNSAHTLFESHTAPNMTIIFTPTIFLPLLGLAMLALLPIFFKNQKKD